MGVFSLAVDITMRPNSNGWSNGMSRSCDVLKTNQIQNIYIRVCNKMEFVT